MRSDTAPDVPVPPETPVLLFDGVCNLCNGFVQFVIERDPEGAIHFASLQSPAGQALLDRFGLPTDEFDSLVLVEGDEYYRKSRGVLRIAHHLGGAYALAWPLRFVPRTVGDAAYDFVADHRYRWFGRREQCMVPTPDLQSRFLD